MRFKLPFRRKAITGTPEILDMLAARQLSPYRSLGGTNLDMQRINSVFVQHQSASYAYLYTHQPAVRSVVDYLARNTAQLGLRVYERVSDDERRYAGDHPAAETLRNPNDFTPGQQFVFNLVADFLIYDNAYVWKFRAGPGAPLVLINVPPSAVGIIGRSTFQAEGYRFYRADGTYFDVPASDVLHWRGYDPNEPRMGVSKLETLRDELVADATARASKTELDKSGWVPRGWIERSETAPEWSPEGMERFRESFTNAVKGGKGTPVLEDGMQFKQSNLSPETTQLLDSRKFTKGEAGAIYGVGNVPPLTADERNQVIEDVLQPLCEMLCDYLDLSILMGEFDADNFYFAFNIDEKRMGNDRLKALTSASGRPVMLTNEARSLVDLPPVKGGNELVTPDNVTAGNKPKPSVGVMPIQDPNKPSQEGDHREGKALVGIKGPEVVRLPSAALVEPVRKEIGFATDLRLKSGGLVVANGPANLKDVDEEQVRQLSPRLQAERARQFRAIDKCAGTLTDFYRRLGHRSKAAKPVDVDRYSKELAEDFRKRLKAIVEAEGDLYVVRLAGEGPFDTAYVENWLEATAVSAAGAIVEHTAKEADENGLRDTISKALTDWIAPAAASLGTGAIRVARTTAAKQAPHPERRMQMWVADTERHASLQGTMVPLGQKFDGILPGEPPNCKCALVIL